MWLTACPVESEQPGTEINTSKSNKIYESSLSKKETSGVIRMYQSFP
jgi:hypothetical protein